MKKRYASLWVVSKLLEKNAEYSFSDFLKLAKAELIQLSKPTLSKILKKLREKDMIRLIYCYYTLKDKPSAVSDIFEPKNLLKLDIQKVLLQLENILKRKDAIKILGKYSLLFYICLRDIFGHKSINFEAFLEFLRNIIEDRNNKYDNKVVGAAFLSFFIHSFVYEYREEILNKKTSERKKIYTKMTYYLLFFIQKEYLEIYYNLLDIEEKKITELLGAVSASNTQNIRQSLKEFLTKLGMDKSTIKELIEATKGAIKNTENELEKIISSEKKRKTAKRIYRILEEMKRNTSVMYNWINKMAFENLIKMLEENKLKHEIV